MRKIKWWLSLLVILLVPICVAAQEKFTEPQQMRSKAVAAFNSGRLQEAKSQLANLIEKYPDYVPAYSIYWDVVGRTGDEASRRTIVERDIKHLVLIPEEKRDEDFYGTLVKAYGILDDRQQVAALKQKAIARFPRGSLAQSARLEAASNEQDPVKSAAMLQSYIGEFSDNTSWTEVAARKKFMLMAKEPELFKPQELVTAAEQYEVRSKAFIEEFGNPYRYVETLSMISETLKEKSPAESLKFAQKGLLYIQENWLHTGEFNESVRFWFWPAMIRAYNETKAWKPAQKLGGAMIRELDRGSLQSPGILKDEAKIRRDYSLALEKTDLVDEAREQLMLAAAIDEGLKKDLATFAERHPIPAAEQRRFEIMLAAKLKEITKRREDYVRTSLLDTKQNRPALGFKLKDMNDKLVSFSDFRGKILILDFWASWCGPCVAELEELKVFYAQHQSNPRVALVVINLDADRGAAIRQAKEKNYNFQILFSDGTLESFYKTQSLPQLYVVDPGGNIRFQHTGYVKDGYFLKKLDWMIEAALK